MSKAKQKVARKRSSFSKTNKKTKQIHKETKQSLNLPRSIHEPITGERNTHILVFVVVILLVLFYFSIFKTGELSFSSSKDISGKGYFGALQCAEVVCDYKITDQFNKEQLVSLSEGSTTSLTTADHTLDVTLIGKGDLPDSCKTHFKWCNSNNGECIEEDKNMINGQTAAYSYGMSVTLDQGFCFEPIIPPCLSDADCTDGTICEVSSGTCIMFSSSDDCTTLGCDNDFICEQVEGVYNCVEQTACNQHSDCSKGKACQNNKCVNEKDFVCVDTDVIAQNDVSGMDQLDYINKNILGKASGIYVVTQKFGSYSDKCSEEVPGRLLEMACNTEPGANVIGHVEIDCEYGCKDGVCELPQQPVLKPSNLLAYWSLNEGSGTITQDSSENKNEGVVHGAAWLAGVKGSALSFDGRGSKVTTSLLYDTSKGTGISVSAWYSTKQPTLSRMTVVGGNNGGRFEVYVDKGKPGCRVWDTGEKSIFAGEQFIDGWHHIVCSQSFNPPKTELYVDGILKKSVEAVSISVGGTWKLGVSGSTSANPFNGIIDEVKLYDQPLSQSEVTLLYDEVFTPPKSQPLIPSCKDTDIAGSNDQLPGGIDVPLEQAEYINYDELGTVATEFNTFTDTCMVVDGTLQLIEQFCDVETKLHASTKYICPKGKICSRGRCIDEALMQPLVKGNCQDSDVVSQNDPLPSGIIPSLDQTQYINYDVKGTVSSGTNVNTDSCTTQGSTTYLTEYFCDLKSNTPGKILAACPEGTRCDNLKGACISTASLTPDTDKKEPIDLCVSLSMTCPTGSSCFLGNCYQTNNKGNIGENTCLVKCPSNTACFRGKCSDVKDLPQDINKFLEKSKVDLCKEMVCQANQACLKGICLTKDVHGNIGDGSCEMTCSEGLICSQEMCKKSDDQTLDPEKLLDLLNDAIKSDEEKDLCALLPKPCPSGSSCLLGNCYGIDDKGNIGDGSCAITCQKELLCINQQCKNPDDIVADLKDVLKDSKIDLCKNINCQPNQGCLKGICLNKNPDGSLGDGTCSNVCPTDSICLSKECLLADDIVITPTQIPKEDGLPSEGDSCIDSKSCTAGLTCLQNGCAKITCSLKQDPLCPENSECNVNNQQCEPTSCNAEKVCKGYYYCAENICQPMYGVTISPEAPFDSEDLIASSSAYVGKGVAENADVVYNWYKNSTSITLFNIPIDVSQVKNTKNSITDISANNLIVERYGGNIYSDTSLATHKYSLSLSGNNEYLKIPFNSQVNLDTFTLELTINPQKLTGKRYIIGSENRFSLVHDSDKGLLFTIYGGKGTTANISLAPLKEKQWYHLALHYAKKTQGSEFSLLVDGTLVATAQTSITMQDIADDIYVGISPAMKQAFEGYVDELRMYPFLIPETQLKKNVKGFNSIHESLTSVGDVWKVVVYIYDAQGKLVVNPNVKSYDQVEIKKNQQQQDVKDSDDGDDDDDDKKGGKKGYSNLYKGNIFDKTAATVSTSVTASKKKSNYFSITKLEKKQKSSTQAAALKPAIKQTKVTKEEPTKPTCSDKIQNQDETNIDCGGSCEPCSEEQAKLARWWIWVVLAVSLFGILVLIGEARIYNLFSRAPRLIASKQAPQTTIVPKEEGALAFMKEQLNQGISRDKIVEHMIAAGWDEEFVHNLFDKHFEHMLSERDKAQITKFVDYYTKKGMSSEEIKQALEDGGWDKDVLDKLLKK